MLKKILRFGFKSLVVAFVLINIILASHAWHFTWFFDPIPKTQAAGINPNGKWRELLLGFRFPKSEITEVPQSHYQTIQLRSTEGLTIEGWYIPADSARGTVLMFHGHSSNKSRLMAEAQWFGEQGYHVLLTDFRAHGNSEGNVCTIGYSEAADIKAAYDFVQGKGEQNIVLWGVSMGAAALLKAIPEYNLQASKVILECPFASLLDAVKGRMRTMNLPEALSYPLTFWGGAQRGFWAFNFEPANYAVHIQTPVLLQWGQLDERVTRQETERIFASFRSAQKELVIYEEAGHESFCKKVPAQWAQQMAKFLAKP
jgi:alpha-beta hydrolase superfamily lysophospholipase